MKKIYLLLSFMALSIANNVTVFAQGTTVFADNFNRTTLSPGGTPSVTYTTTVGGGASIGMSLISGSNYEVIMNSGTNGTSSDRFTAPMSGFSSPFSLVLSSNVGVVTWTFNMKISSASTSTTPTQGTMGGGIDLCGNQSTNIYNGAPVGYGVVFIPTGVALVKYSAGLHTNSVLISQTTSVTPTDYLSVRVTYDPATNHWSLYVRDDGSSAFADPSSGVTTQQGSTITDATYTSNAMTLYGAVFTYTSGTGKNMAVDNYTVSIAGCSGSPTPGNTNASATTLCAGNTTNLSLQTATPGSGLSYAWQAAPDAGGTPGTYSAISGATNATYTPTLSSTTWYNCIVTCSFSSTSTTSNQVQVSVNPTPAAIAGVPEACVGSTSALSDATSGGAWSSTNTGVATIGSTGTLTGVALGNTTISYVLPTGCYQAEPASIVSTPPTPTVTPSSALICSGGNATLTGSSANVNLFPVESWENGVPSVPGTPVDGWNIIGSSTVTAYVIQASAGVAYPSVSGAENGTYFLDWESFYENTGSPTVYSPPFSMVGVTGAQLSFWVWRDDYYPYSAYYGFTTEGFGIAINTTNSLTGATLLGAVPRTYDAPISGSLSGTSEPASAGWYQYTVSIPATFTGSTNYILFNMVTQYGDNCYLDNVSLTGTVPATWSPTSNLFLDAGYTTPYTAGTQASTVYLNQPAVTSPTSVTYTASVVCASANIPVSVNPIPGAITGTTTICTGLTSALGNSATGGAWSSSATSVATVGSTGIVSALFAGSSNISYAFTGCGTAVTTVNVNTSPNLSNFTTPSISAPCGGFASTVTVHSTSLAAGTYRVTYNLTGANTATGDTATLTMGSGSGTFTSAAFASTGSTTLTITSITSTLGCNTNTSSGNAVTFTVTAVPAAISGTPVVCQGLTTTLTDAGGGTWSSSNSSVATATGLIGTVTGIGAGNATITYSVAGCLATTIVTVNATGPISGVTGACAGSTTTLSNTSGAGSWSSANPSVATINASTGVVTGVLIGTAIVSFTLTSTGCVATTTVSITPPPYVYTITGGGAYCVGGSGVTVGINGSSTSASYELFSGGALIPPAVGGTGSALTIGTITTPGTYTIVANPGTGCATTMYGTATVTTNPLPVVYSVTGGGSYCPGGLGLHIGVNPSDIGIDYQLMTGGIASGLPIPGTGGAIDFGLVTALGTYKVQATNSVTGCSDTMSGNATIAYNSFPTAYAVNSGGGYCAGTAGVDVNLSNSATGIYYQLYLGSVASGSPVSGSTGFGIDFGYKTTSGVYTVVATNPTTSCTSNMSGAAVVTLNPLPALNNVTGGGAYCIGGTGVHVGVNGSVPGISYRFYQNGTAIGSPLTGTGAALDFGLDTAQGAFTVVAANIITTCTVNMTGSVTVTTNPLPITYPIAGGGQYCSGGTGVDVNLSNSNFGINYRLYNSNTPVGASVAGTGTTVDFGLQTLAGYYTVIATNPLTTCTVNMPGIDTVTVNALPGPFNVTGGGSYCIGGTGVAIGLSGSKSGTSYQLYTGGAPAGLPVTGSGGAITFGLQTTAGSYTAVATNTVTACTRNMTGSVGVTVNPLPTIYSVTGGGAFCSAGTGVHIGLSGSDFGTQYQLYLGVGVVGSALAGTGGPLDFGLIAIAGTSYTVIANNPATTCSSNMTGTATVTVNPYPNQYAMGLNSSYCAGGTGSPVSLTHSDAGINYQLYNGSAPVGSAVPGGSSPLSFGNEPAGIYTVIATNATTACATSMLGSSVISANPLPTTFMVTGGGNYCSGSATTPAIGLAGSTTSIRYQLKLGAASIGTVTGAGPAISFGPVAGSGTYTVTALNIITGCTSNMVGTASIGINPLPLQHNITETGGGVYCAGGTGIDIGLNGSETGINYQLYNGSTATGSLVLGSTGTPLDFGYHLSAGTRTIIGTNAVTGCSNTMLGSAVISISPLPLPFPVTGGGGICPGSTTGVDISLPGSEAGTAYQLYNGSTAEGGPVFGSGGSVDFGPQTDLGTYTVVATNAAYCNNNMTGSVSVYNYALPAMYTVTGGGSYCAGGSGLPVSLNGSDTGTAYQVYVNDISTTDIVTGTGAPISFGVQSMAGSYTIVATSSATTCSNEMNDSATITVNALPTTDTLTGGGNYCVGGSGLDLMLNNSDLGVSYQLYRSSSPVGGMIPGTGSPLDLGVQSTPGIYTVVATNVSTFCANNMYGNDTINVNPLPASYSVTGGGNYCAGGAGMHIGLSGSATGVTYHLYVGGVPAGVTVTGSGSAIDFGAITAGGIYTIVANNTATGCTKNMTGSATITVNPAPDGYSITGGGGYCIGGSGVVIGISGSDAGTTYQLLKGGTPAGSALLGTGAPLNFGIHAATDTYRVLATNTATSCPGYMPGYTVVTINPLPTPFIVSGSAASYCAGGTGINIYLSGTSLGVNYLLYRGTAIVGTSIAGTTTALDFGAQTIAGTYTVFATNPTTTCTNSMSGAAVVNITPLPNAYSVIGGGSYCAGGSGVHVGLLGSQTGVKYQLFNGSGATVGSPVTGAGAAIDFGLQTAAGTYTIAATNATTGCTNNMSGGATVGVNPLPLVYSATGGGSYCLGGTGVNVGLSGSVSGTNYQLYYGSTAIGAPMGGTGTAISFGLQTAAGSYTIKAMDAVTTCGSNMTGSAVVNTNPLPLIYSITGGGNYCPGDAGVHIGLSGSNSGIAYQLFNGSVTSGSPMAGTGATLDFGLHTSSTGLYTVVATNSATGCTSNMTGSAMVGLNPIPDINTVTGGGNYCTGSPGVHIGLSTSGLGISYQLWNGGIATGSPVTGTGTILDLGAQTAAGTYLVIATNTSTGCTSLMAGSAVITVGAPVTPSVNISTGMGDTVCAGTTITFMAMPSNGGTAPSYQWTVNGAYTSIDSSYSYVPVNGDIVSVTMTSSASCAIPGTATKTITMTVNPMVLPGVLVSVTPGNDVCLGTTVHFTATPTNGGSAPVYLWKKNGLDEGGSSSYTIVPANGDNVFCYMSSSNPCRLENTVSSNHIIIEVDEPTTPVVIVTATPGAYIVTGQTDILVANTTYGGPNPTYTWYVNGSIIPGAITSELSGNNFQNLDSVTCVVTSSGSCSGLMGSGHIIIHVRNNEGVQQIASAGSDIQLIPNPNKGLFTIKGTLGSAADEEATVEVTDILGQVIYTSKIMAHNGVINETIQLNNSIANGMYILNLHSATQNQVFHMVIEQ